jgi:hypothetical protein
MASECLSTFLLRERIFHVWVARLADALNFTNFGLHEHASCVQVDAAIVSMLLVVEPHHGLPGDGPACRSRFVVVDATTSTERSTLGHASPLIPFYLGRAAGSSPSRP